MRNCKNNYLTLLSNKSNIVHGRKPNRKEPEMTIELVKILEAAKEHYDMSMTWFECEQNATSITHKESYSIWSRQEEERYKGILEAYEIMTGRKVYGFEIENELSLC